MVRAPTVHSPAQQHPAELLPPMGVERKKQAFSIELKGTLMA